MSRCVCGVYVCIRECVYVCVYVSVCACIRECVYTCVCARVYCPGACLYVYVSPVDLLYYSPLPETFEVRNVKDRFSILVVFGDDRMRPDIARAEDLLCG